VPRIRTLKPEHKQHRKVGRLSDAHYRLWAGLLTESDDEGRLEVDPVRLRLLVWGYHPEVTVEMVEERLKDLDATGLVRLYSVKNVQYAVFPSFLDHQRIDRPQKSKLPKPPPYIVHESSAKRRRTVGERSTTPRRRFDGDRIGSKAVRTTRTSRSGGYVDKSPETPSGQTASETGGTGPAEPGPAAPPIISLLSTSNGSGRYHAVAAQVRALQAEATALRQAGGQAR
jgi:hypothetical protein